MLFPTEVEARLLPDVIIIGVKKAGTGALRMFLGLHPRIVVDGREMHFFDKTDRYRLGFEEYIRMLPTRQPSNQLLLEATPAYFFEPEVEKRIHAAMPDVKLLLIVREPVTRMISEYAHNHYIHLNVSVYSRTFEVHKQTMLHVLTLPRVVTFLYITHYTYYAS